jgi:hypothetical protein
MGRKLRYVPGKAEVLNSSGCSKKQKRLVEVMANGSVVDGNSAFSSVCQFKLNALGVSKRDALSYTDGKYVGQDIVKAANDAFVNFKRWSRCIYKPRYSNRKEKAHREADEEDWARQCKAAQRFCWCGH